MWNQAENSTIYFVIFDCSLLNCSPSLRQLDKQLSFKNKAPILKSVNLISFSTAWVSGISPDVNVQAKM